MKFNNRKHLVKGEIDQKESIYKILHRLWGHISTERRGQFSLLLLLMVIVSFAEIFSIGAVIPFLSILSNPQYIFKFPFIAPHIHGLDLNSSSKLLSVATFVFIVAILISGALRLLLLYASTRLTFAAGADLSMSIYRRTLYQPYVVHINRNSSEIINGITSKTAIVINTLNSVLTLIGSSIIFIMILIALFSINPAMIIKVLIGFAIIYMLIIFMSRRRQLAYSRLIADESTYMIKLLQEGLGGIRDILIDGAQEVYCKIYKESDARLRHAQGNNQFIGQFPRYVVEALCMVLIAFLAYLSAMHNDGMSQIIPIFGAFALAAQRLLPMLQQAYQSWSSIQGSLASLVDAIDLLDQPLPDGHNASLVNQMKFEHNISLCDVSFQHSSSTPLLFENLNLAITKGSCIGFIGVTGSGKSTLLDLLMGLLNPTQGHISIDGVPVTFKNFRSWQSHITHVPQNIFLADSSIAENIAFGIPKDEIDGERVRLAAQRAQISKIIETWEMQYQTVVGEKGVRLSGGQRQRIGIARALYKEASVIILDEATSALDGETEQLVMDAIESFRADMTILIVAHRKSTLKCCDIIFNVSEGAIRKIGNYHDLEKLQ